MVEDNPVNVKITSKILSDAGYLVHSVENGQDALDILDQKDFDLILMDGEMPIMDGYQTTKNIREGKIFKKFTRHQTIPIIALMASSSPETIKKSQASGMNNHIEKSIANKAELIEMVRRYLG